MPGVHCIRGAEHLRGSGENGGRRHVRGVAREPKAVYRAPRAYLARQRRVPPLGGHIPPDGRGLPPPRAVFHLTCRCTTFTCPCIPFRCPCTTFPVPYPTRGGHVPRARTDFSESCARFVHARMFRARQHALHGDDAPHGTSTRGVRITVIRKELRTT